MSQDLTGLKILMIAPCLGKFGGIEAFCLTLCEDLLLRGATVRLMRKKVNGFRSDGSIEKNEDEISSSWTSNVKKKFFSEYLESRSRRIHQGIKDCDLVHLHNPVVEGVWWAKKEKKPCTMTVYNWKRKGLHPRLLAWKWAVKNADRRWYISEFVWDTWEKVRRKNSDRLPVVSRMVTGECPIKQRRGFLLISRFVPNKGIRILLKAYQRVSPDPLLWPLILVGDGPLRVELEKIIFEENINGVYLTGFVSEEDRHRYTREAKWMVIPPHTNEDLGLTPLEARSVGVPCIASTDGGVKETAGPYALFCEPGDVESLKGCLSQAIEMSEKDYEAKSCLAKKELKKYVRPLDEYAEVYLKLLKK
jgi:glycosyltransferase involved in cell wall biosynthesis